MINQIKTALLLGALAGLMLLVGFLLGGQTGLTIALIIAILMNFSMFWFSDRIVLFIYKAKEADRNEHKELYKMVSELSKEAGMPMPKVCIVPSEQPNAFATGKGPKSAVVACTTGILKLLNKEELKGVIAHEISHVKNKDILITTIAATIAAVISYIAMFARFGAIFGGDDDNRGNIISILILAILTPIIAMIIQLAISRSREYLADETGARLIKNPTALANALQKLEEGAKKTPMRMGGQATSSLFIVNPFSGGGLFALLSTHPPMQKRIARLKEMKV